MKKRIKQYVLYYCMNCEGIVSSITCTSHIDKVCVIDDSGHYTVDEFQSSPDYSDADDNSCTFCGALVASVTLSEEVFRAINEALKEKEVFLCKYVDDIDTLSDLFELKL